MNRKSSRLCYVINSIRLTCLLLSSVLIVQANMLIVQANMLNVQVNNESSETVGRDIILLLDTSGSMNDLDSEHISLKSIKLITELTQNSDRLGFITYNHEAVTKIPLDPMSGDETKDRIKKAVDEVVFRGDTDLGLGIDTAVDALLAKQEPGRESIIILISDGDTDLSSGLSNRTEADSNQDLLKALEIASEHHIKIHTVGLVKQFNASVDYLYPITKATGGESKVATGPYDLVYALLSLYYANDHVEIENISSITATGKKQEVELDTKESRFGETLFIVVGQGEQSQELNDEFGEKINPITKEDYYTIYQKPVEGIANYRLNLKYAKDANVNVFGITSYDLSASLEVQSEGKINSTLSATFYLTNSVTDQKIEDEEIYQNAEIRFYIQKDGSSEKILLEGIPSKDGVTMQYKLLESGNYVISTESNHFGKAEFLQHQITVMNEAPVGKKTIEDTLCIGEDAKSYNLKELFEDTDDEGLQYSITGCEGEQYISWEQLQSVIQVQPLEYGDSYIYVQATDPVGNTANSTITIHSLPYWKLHINTVISLIILGITLITAIGVVLILRLRKKGKKKSLKFDGVLIGHFVMLKSNRDMLPMEWNLKNYDEEEITLSYLLEDSSVWEYAQEASKIFFQPSKEGLTLVHRSASSIFVNNKNVKQGNSVLLYPGDEIYVCFQDNCTELELHYSR